ncbi:MAG TPA: DMT family transporter [Actinomycetota bacterium]|nr:DMT family transporter [Actinomycetota bacterium]
MIYGLIAAVGWGLADFFGAVVGRRIGSLWTVIVAQTFTAIVATGIVLASGDPVRPVTTVLGAVALNAVFSATAYVTHYKALELGPVAVVSPIGATYALVGVVLAIVVLGERPNAAVLIGGIITIVGVMLTSTDLQKLRAGIRHRPPGLPWAIVSAVGFGVGGFLLAYLSRELGWIVGLWASRCAQLVGFLVVGLYRRDELRGHFPVGAWLAAAIGVGLADLLGVTAFSIGAHAGFVSIVLVASAVFPLIAVTLSIGYLGERPVPNQYVGVGLTVVGLLVLGLGA